MKVVLDVLFVTSAVLLIVLSLLQGGKSEGASGAIMGGTTKVFNNIKERGAELIVSRITLWTGVVFFILAVLVITV